MELYSANVTHADGGDPIDLHSRGKRPRGKKWEERARRDPPEAAVAVPRHNALNTGILCDGLRVIDNDIDDATRAAKVKALAIELLGETLIRTRANSGRTALVYRAAEGQPGKRSIVGTFGKVEVLGYGEQLHAFGPHYTGVALDWYPEAPGTVSADSLPAVTEAAVGAFLEAAAAMIGAEVKPVAAPYAEARTASVMGLAAGPLDVAAALGVIPNNGPVDWNGWNRIGLATYAATAGNELGRAAWHAWSRKHPAYDEKETEARWQHYDRHKDRELPDGKAPIGAGTLFDMARAASPGWIKPSDAARAAPTSRPATALDLVTADTLPPPNLPLHDVFPGGWAAWIADAAESKGAPPDYVAVELLAGAGALIGNARWANPWEGWQEPPAINGALIGNPSAGKSPALDALVDPLAAIEAADNEDWKERKRQHATDKTAAAERRALWEKDVKEAVKKGAQPPTMPADAVDPDPPQRRRILSTDPTVAKAERMSAANHRGLVLVRDELAGWIAGMDRFTNSAGSDRAFWLQAYGGRPWTPDRVKDGDAEIAVPHLLWSVVGGIQPDRLASLMLAGDDDGLAARFLYTWPAPLRPKRPRDGLAVGRAREWLARLRALPWTPPVPVLVPFDRAAQVVLQEWRERVASMEEGAAGLFLSWLGKLPGFAVRLALILAHLGWCEHGQGDPPGEVREADVRRAVRFLADYAVPMARRCFGEAALPEAERDARRLARWYLRLPQPRPEVLNARALRRMANGPGIPTAPRIEAALAELAELGWVRPAPGREGGSPGRQRADWTVNLAVREAAPP